MADSPRSPCPVVYALDLLGDRWTLLVVRDMVFFGRSTYGEFLEAGESISTNILADRLKRLLASGIVTKTRDPEHGSRFRYRMTERGLELVPALLHLIRWSSRHDADSPLPQDLRERLEGDLDAFAAEIVKRYESGQASSSGPPGAA